MLPTSSFSESTGARTLGGHSGCHSIVARGLPNGAVSLYRGKDSWRRASPAGHDSSAGEYRVRCGLHNGGKLGHQSGRHGGTTWKLGTLDMKERQTDRQTDRRTDGRTDRHTDRHTDRQTHRTRQHETRTTRTCTGRFAFRRAEDVECFNTKDEQHEHVPAVAFRRADDVECFN